jgi:hypothetical protein
MREEVLPCSFAFSSHRPHVVSRHGPPRGPMLGWCHTAPPVGSGVASRRPRHPSREPPRGAAHAWYDGRSPETAHAVPSGPPPSLAPADPGGRRTATRDGWGAPPATLDDRAGAPGERSPCASTGSGGATDGAGATNVAPRRDGAGAPPAVPAQCIRALTPKTTYYSAQGELFETDGRGAVRIAEASDVPRARADDAHPGPGALDAGDAEGPGRGGATRQRLLGARHEPLLG